MDKLRVFQNVKKKRTVSGDSLWNSGTVLLILLFLPYVITLFFGNLWKAEETANMEAALKEQLNAGIYTIINKTSIGEERIPIELYVADVLARTMSTDYEKEALKAQAILIRTNLSDGGKTELLVEDEDYGREKVPEICYLAAAETKGMCLTYEGAPVYGAYFKVSSGMTRNAGELLEEGEYPYLSSVSCDRDFLSEEYTDIMKYDLSEFERKWEDLQQTTDDIDTENAEKASFAEDLDIAFLCDSAGYVTYIGRGGKWVSGENFRYAFALPSSSFQIQSRGKEVIFTTKGIGHGLGMSQFGANEMAKEGKSYSEILSYFFKDTKLTKIE